MTQGPLQQKPALLNICRNYNSLSNRSDSISPRLCKIPFLLAYSAHFVEAIKNLTQTQTILYTQILQQWDVKKNVYVYTHIKHTCFSLLWIINPGRQPRARADPHRVKICGLFSPLIYWHTSTSKHVCTNRHKIHTLNFHNNCGKKGIILTHLEFASQPCQNRLCSTPRIGQTRLILLHPKKQDGD